MMILTLRKWYKCSSATHSMGKQLSIRINDELEQLIEEEQEAIPYDVPESEIVRAAIREQLPRSGSSDSKAGDDGGQTDPCGAD